MIIMSQNSLPATKPKLSFKYMENNSVFFTQKSTLRLSINWGVFNVTKIAVQFLIDNKTGVCLLLFLKWLS